MSDTVIRAIHRQYLKGSVSIDLFLFMLDRHGVTPTWDWVAGGMQFYELPLEKKVSIFLQKWPIDLAALDQSRLADGINGTFRRGKGIYWDASHEDAPSVAEILNETVGDLAYYYGLRTPPNPWMPSFTNFIADEVESVQYLIVLLQHYQLLPS